MTPGLLGPGSLARRFAKSHLEDLSLVNLFLNGPAGDQAVHDHVLLLPDTVSPVDALVVYGRVPVRVHDNDTVCLRESEAEAADAGGEKEDLDRRVCLEALHTGLPLLGAGHAPVYPTEGEVSLREFHLNNVEELPALGEHEGAVPRV